MLFVALTVPVARLALAYLARRRRWSDVSAQSTSSYDLWLGLERGPMGGLRPLRGRGDRQTAGVVGPPGSGKTLDLILPGLLCWAGSAVATSTKTDVVPLGGRRTRGAGAAARRRRPPPRLVGPGRSGPRAAHRLLGPARRLPRRAGGEQPAAALLGAVDEPRGRDTGDGFWKEGAGTVLRPTCTPRRWWPVAWTDAAAVGFVVGPGDDNRLQL